MFNRPRAMTKTCILPEFLDQQAADAAKILYGIEGTIKRLNGERDLNFLITSAASQSQQRQVVFKIANSQENAAMLECQHDVFTAMAKVDRGDGAVAAPKTIQSVNGKSVESVISASGEQHFCRAVGFVAGRLMSAVNPHTAELLESLGETVGQVDQVLADFKHDAIERPLLWNMNDAVEILERYKPLLGDDSKTELIALFQNRFIRRVLPLAHQLRFGAIHNDANGDNVIVEGGPWNQRVKGIIDYGDMVYSWIAVDPAVAAAYAMLDKHHPLDAAASVIKGYCRKFPLTEVEISVLFELMCMRLCLSVCICAEQKSQSPDNEYLRISEQSAWRALAQLQLISADFAHYLFRDSCGYAPVPTTARVVSWLQSNSEQFKSIVEVDLRADPLLILDVSVGSAQMPNPAETIDPVRAAKNILRAIEDAQCVAAIGKYDEYRLIYSAEDFTDATGHRRTLHLGIDIFMPAGSTLYAPLAGKIHGVENNHDDLGYGGTLILEHLVDGKDGALKFYTLYGHLRPVSLAHHTIGDAVAPAQKIAELGDIHENGHWPPHVHFQIITDMLGQTDTFVGVGSHAHRNIWLNLCPDANMILGIPGIPDSRLNPHTNDPDKIAESIASSRAQSLSPSLSLSYRQPIHLARGSMQYLYDYSGQKYLDAVNNVAHVGHCHPQVVEAARRQSGVLNTNTRYLYSQIEKYSERLLNKFPDPLSVCFLVNSGSEANDLALRLARHYTRRKDIIILDHAYHGNLASLIEISPYKHNGPGGAGASSHIPPSHIHIATMPDRYRGPYSSEANAVLEYVDSVKDALQSAENQSGAAAFIAESILGCGGQMVLPDGYLTAVYEQVRDFGGLCIADEVQTGFGRVGSHFWAFASQDVIPDIVTLGKPMGNGHPLAAVITTREIADEFNNGMEYFNTFGGNPVSCAIGDAVLEVIEHEQLQQNALRVGAQLLAQLSELKARYPLIGDVRGLGLFIGIELVDDRESLQPAAEQADYIVERMKQEGVLISADGPLRNVLKIKPPLCFTEENVDQFTSTLEQVLKEDFATTVMGAP